MCVKQYVVPYRYVTFACSSPVVSQFTDLARKVKHDMCVLVSLVIHALVMVNFVPELCAFLSLTSEL